MPLGVALTVEEYRLMSDKGDRSAKQSWVDLALTLRTTQSLYGKIFPQN